jgi:hypothetical protein
MVKARGTQKTAVGKVSRVGRKYFFKAGKKKVEIPVGSVVSKQLIGGVVGKEVEALVFRGTVVGVRGPGRPPILCYIPAASIFSAVEPAVQHALKAEFIKQGIITGE